MFVYNFFIFSWQEDIKLSLFTASHFKGKVFLDSNEELKLELSRIKNQTTFIILPEVCI